MRVPARRSDSTVTVGGFALAFGAVAADPVVAGVVVVVGVVTVVPVGAVVVVVGLEAAGATFPVVLENVVATSPAAVCAVTRTRSVCETDSVPNWYACFVAPATFRQPLPSLAHSCHWYVYVEAGGIQIPFVTDRVCPNCAVPLIAGWTSFDGPFVEAITGLGSDVASFVPSLFVAVTVTVSVRLTSAATSVYVLLV
jgi:hypothetical protein